MTVIPAYGKRYSSVDEVKQAWENNEDFKIVNGPYINKRDYENYCSILDSVHYSFGGTTIALVVGLLS